MVPVASPDKRIAEIDGLRAVAMTMVVAQHCGLMPFGWTGVWLFFVISGFVITRTLMAEAADGASAAQRYGRFVARRFFRIVPVYLAYLAVASIALFLSGGRAAFGDMPFLMTFTFNWQMIYGFVEVTDRFPPFAHLWTLSVEEQFYIFYPLLFLFLPARLFRPALMVLVALGPLIRLLTSASLVSGGRAAGDVAFGVYASSLSQFDAFVIGALIASYETELRKSVRVSRVLLAAAFVVGVGYAAVMAAINAASGARGFDIVRNIYSGTIAGQGREVFTYMVVDLAAAAVVVAAVAGNRLLRPFAAPVLVRIGSVSYGAYLFHAFVIWLIATLILAVDSGLAGRLTLFAIAWPVTVALAALSFDRFEKPLMRYGRRKERYAPVPAGAVHELQTSRQKRTASASISIRKSGLARPDTSR